MNEQDKERPKTKLQMRWTSEGLVIDQREAYPDGRGGWKWERHVIILSPEEAEKLKELIN